MSGDDLALTVAAVYKQLDTTARAEHTRTVTAPPSSSTAPKVHVINHIALFSVL